MRRLLLVLLTLSHPVAAQEAPRWQTLDEPQQVASPAQETEIVSLEAADRAPPEVRALEVGIVVLDSGIDGDSLENRRRGVFPEVRLAETRYLPYALRRTLVDSNQWGAVRVLPGHDPGYEVLISGEILASDGRELRLHLVARDSRDVIWLDKTYSGIAGEQAYLESERRRRRPFQDLYNRFANDLLAARHALDDDTLRRVREISELRYAAGLLPDVFSGFIARDEEGRVTLTRLPARDDPMLTRVRRVREQEYLFIDATDEQYAELYTDMSPVYDLWRQFQREQLAFRDAWEQRLAERDSPPKGSYQDMKQQYNNYKWEKIQRQEMKTLAEGFDNEIAPTALELDGTVIQLSGSLDERYREWRDILRRIYRLETGT